jgi:hypothetical protein
VLSDTQFGKGFDAGIDQTQGLGGALKATVGSAIGKDEWVDSGLAYYRQKMQDAANVGANVTSVEEIDSFGDFTDWAGYTLGTLVPDVIGGGVGGFAAKAGAKKLLKSKLEQEADTIGKRLAEKAVQKNYDAAAGFVAYSGAQNTASNFAEIYDETGIEAPGKALAVGVAQGALDQFGVPQRAFKRMFGSDGLEQFNDDIAERVFMSKDYVMAVSREAIKAAGVEGFTEATQEFLGRAAVAWAEESLPVEQQREFMDIVADERSKSMYINAFASGSLAGLVGGGAIQATKFGGKRPEQPDPEGGSPFSEEAEQARINRMPEARRKVVALTQGDMTIDTEAGPTPEPTPGTVSLTAQETTIQPGQDSSMDVLLEGYDQPPADPKLYWGNMPVPLQKQLIVDGIDDDLATENTLRSAAEKLEGSARTSALNAIDASTSRNTRRAVPKATQQTDEFSGEIFMVSTPETLSQKIEAFHDAANRGPIPKAMGAGEFVSDGVTEADINFNITPSQAPVFMGTEDGRTVQLPGLTDFVGSTDPTANPATEEAASIYLDLAMRGMPSEFRDLIKGTHILSTEDIPHDADAAFLDRSSVIGMRFDHLLEGADDEQRARRNRFNTAHEVMHAADFKNGYSESLDHFKMKVEDIDGDGQPDISMGRAIEEIFDLWESDAEGSGFFAYPLDSLYDNIANQNGDPEKIQRVLDSAREELFAQLGASYVANEGSIQKSLPFGHSIIEDIFANPVPAEQLVTNDVRGLYGNQEANQEAATSEGAGVLRDVRAPAESGSIQVQDEGGAGGTGGPSVVEEQAGESVGGTPEPEAGDTAGQVLPVEIQSVKRAEDFDLDGTMNVTMADGDVYQISRDPVARGWVLDPQHDDEFNLDPTHPYSNGILASNRKETEAIITQLHNEKLERNAPAVEAEPAPRQELRDTLIQSISEDGISAAQLSEQVGQEEGNFRDLLDQMEEDGDILSELTPDGERYFPNPNNSRFIRVPTEYTPPRRQKSGKYVGAPRGINTPDKLRRLRQAVKEIAKKGEYGRFWYERSGKNILEITGGNKEDARKLVAAIAITSPQTGVDTNFEFAVQAYYQWKNGKPIESGIFPTSMGKKMEDVFNSDKGFSGRKTSNFENNLLRVIDDDLEQGVTTDIWMMRAFGYPSDNPTDLNYDFVENETLRIANELGWEPQQVQAAIWVEIKARMESKPLKKAVDALSQLKGYFKFVSDSKGKKIRQFKDLASEQAHGQLWVKKALAYEPTEAEMESAKFDYKDAALNKLAQISVESIPSTKSGHFPEIFDATEGEIIEFHHQMDKAFLDDDGYDIVARELGMLQMGVSVGLGSWEGRNDPVSQNEVVVPRQYRVKEDGVISKDAEDLIHAYSAVKGILLKQDAIGYHRPFFKDSNTRASQNGADVDIGRPFSKRETQEISRLLSEYGIEPISTGTGVRFINFSDADGNSFSGLVNYARKKSETDFEKAINNALTQIEFDNDESFTAKRFVSDNGLIENDWTENTNGEGYLENRLSGRPDLQGRVKDLVTQLQPRVRQVEDEFSERYGWTQNRELNRVYDEQPETQPEVSKARFIRRTNPKPAAFRDEDLRAVARETAVREFESSGIEPGESVADIDIDELIIPPTFRRLLRALERDDYLGFDRIDDVMLAVFDDDIDGFDPSPGLKSSIGRYINDTMGENGPIVPVSNRTIPKVASAYKKLRRGEIEIDEYLRVVGSTVKPYTSVPDPASVEEMRGALQANQKDLIDVAINEGAEVGLRLDIPAYDRHNVWVPTIHEKTTKSHRSTARVAGALFKAAPNTSIKIMEGDMSKVTYARIMGSFVNKTPEQNYNDAVAALNDPQWTQVGMDPRRREGFYDRRTMDPIISAEEVIQVGPLVLAKNAVRGDINKARYHRREEQADSHDISFNLDDEYLVTLDLDQRLSRAFPASLRKALGDRIEKLKELENRMAASVGLERLPASISAHDAENLMHSKVQNQIDKFEDSYIKPIAALMKAAELDTNQVGLYLLAKHAPERNRVIAEREREMRAQQIEQLNKALEDSMGALDRPSESIVERLDRLENEPLKFQETGSGMTDEQSVSVVATAKLEDKYDALEEIADKTYEMLTAMRQNMVDKGLLDDETREDWQDRYEFYVPLKGFAATEVDGDMVTGNGSKGFSIKGKESFKAKGRITMPENPLLNSFIDGETKIVRAEKNVIAQRLLKLVTKFKSSQWSVYPPTQYPFQSPPDDISVRKSQSVMANEERPDAPGVKRYIQVKRNGQDHFIEIRDLELNKQLQSASIGIFNSDIESLNQVMQGLRMFQNFRRNMYINYNPTWGAVNPIRDVQTGVGYLLAEQDSRAGRLKGKKIIKNVIYGYPSAYKALWRDSRGKDPETDKARELAQYVQDYKDDGAPTGLSYTKNLDEQGRRIKRLMNEGNVMKTLKFVGKYVEDFNQVMENVTRFSTYVESRKAGVERTTAATIAKDLTVNFNRKGELSGSMDTFFLFFNAAWQGNINTAGPALKSGRDGEKITKARALIAGLVMFGFARTLMNIWMSGEDDDGESTYLDYNEYAQKTGMLFRMSDEQGVAIPKSYGWGFYDDLGRLGAELSMNLKDPDTVAVDLFGSIDRHFNPQGIHAVEDRDAVESAVLKLGFLASPDVGDFLLEQAANINYFGENIEVPQNSFLIPTPASQKTRRGTADWIESTTKTIAQVFGGSDYRDGTLEINPDRVQHALNFMFGGMGRFFNDAADTAHKWRNDKPDDLKLDDIPIIRSFFPRPSAYKDRVTFYDARNEWGQYWDEYSDANSTGKAALREEFGPKLYQFEIFHKQANKALRKLSQQKKKVEQAENVEAVLRYRRLDEISDQQELIYDRYNKRWNEIKP